MIDSHRDFVDLGKKINPLHLNSDMFVGPYILNLIAKLFEAMKEYTQIFYNQPSSPHLDKVLHKWRRYCEDSKEFLKFQAEQHQFTA